MDPITWLALGDSYTIGEGIDAPGRWPVQLAALLRARGCNIAAPRIIARTGWTTGELLAAMDEAGLDGEWGIVSLLVGVNNQYRGQPLARYAAELDILLARAIAHAGDDPGRVVMLSIPDWGVTPFAGDDRRSPQTIAADIDAFNAAAAAVCAALGIAFVDITPISRRDPGDLSLLADDRLHPSAAQYALWAAAALDVANVAVARAARAAQ